MGSRLFGDQKSHSESRELFILNLIAALIGVGVGHLTLVFKKVVHFFENAFWKLDFGLTDLSPLEYQFSWWVILIPGVGLLLTSLLIRYWGEEVRGHGVPEVMESIITKAGVLNKRIIPTKILASGLTIASGGSVGSEGPIVHIGSSFGSWIGQVLKIKSSSLKILVGCGASAAIASTFNTPVGGVIFAVEVILSELKTKSFVPLVIATVFATIVTKTYFGDLQIFTVPEYSLQHPLEFAFYIILGLLAGILGIIFMRAIYASEDLVEKVNLPFWARPLLLGPVIGLIAYYYPQTFGVGYETMNQVLDQNIEIQLVVVLIFLKILTTSLTLAAGGSGGVFAQSLYLGCLLGAGVGYLAHSFLPGMTASYGAYALVGMAALFSATGRAAFTSIVLLFEMTLDYSIILPLMLSCVIATETSFFFSRHSIYTLKLARKGLKVVLDFGANILDRTLVRQIMSPHPIALKGEMSIEEAHQWFAKYPHKIYPVIDRDNFPIGIVFMDEIEKWYHRRKETDRPQFVEEIMTRDFQITGMNDTVHDAIHKIEDPGKTHRLLVLDEDFHLVGIVSSSDLLRLVNEEES